jgi:hypothetical protein
LTDKDFGYKNNRGLGRGISAAYRYWKEKDPVIHHAIAYSYVDRNGKIPWDKE